MELFEAIYTRKSIRKYKNIEINQADIQEILKAAMNAPSAGNQRAWQFLVVDNKEVLAQIPVVHPYAEMVRLAPVAIVVCGDLSKEKHTGFWVQDCAAATQNILLAAHQLGLGACWLGVHPVEERVNGISAILKLPENIIPLSIIPIGYPDENPDPKENYEPERVRYNSW